MHSYTLNDFNYSYEKKENRTCYKIENVKEKIIYPDRLSKYYGLSCHSIESLEKSLIYLPQSDDFNDLFDTSPTLWDLTNIQYNQIKNYFEKFKIKYDEKKLENQFRDDRITLIKEFRDLFHQHLLSKFSLVCMTNEKRSDTMWGYYGNNEGFLVEYNHSLFKKAFLQGPFPINYLKAKERLNPNLIKDWELTHIINILTKKNIWEHEKEYRFIVETPGLFELKGYYKNDNIHGEKKPRIFPYPVESVLGVYLGFYFPKNEKIMKINIKDTYSLEFISDKKRLKNDLLKTCIEKKYKIYQMVVNESKLCLDYKQIKVTPVSDYKFQIEYID